MDLSELSYRLDQFEDRVVLITNAPRMMHKIAILREWNLSVHMGMDAFLRMVDEYGIIGIGAFRANFIVVDRIINGARHSYPLAQRGHKPPNVHSSHLSHSLPEEMLKVSSAEIRKQMEGRALELTKAALKALKN